MISKDQPFTRDLLKISLGLLVSGAAVIILLWLIDLDQVIQALKAVNYRKLIPVILLLLISYGARAASWGTILAGNLPYGKVFLTMNAGYLINTLLPFRMGEIGRALLLRTNEIDFWQIIPTILLERFFDLIFALTLFFSVLPFLFGVEYSSTFVGLLAALVLVSFLSLLALKKNQHRVLAWFETNGGRAVRIKNWVGPRMKDFFAGLEILSDPGRFLRAFLWMAASWALALTYQYLLLEAVVGEARLLWVAFSLGAVALGAAVPSSPGNLGVYEASLMGALLVFGIDRSQALTYAILSHFLNLGVTAIFGSLALILEGFSLNSVWAYRAEQGPSPDRKEGR